MIIPAHAEVHLPLTVEGVLRTAEHHARLSDWGRDQSFLLGLERLVAAAEAFGPTPALRAAAHNWIVELLVMRLHMVQDENRHPEILAQQIEKPLVVLGLPRAGTTILYDLLSLDPDSRAPREWEIVRPWPAPEVESFGTDPRIGQLQDSYDSILAISPEMNDIHRLDATQPGECNSIMVHHFASPNFAALLAVPDYDEWLISLDRVPGRYPAHKRILQQLQWRGPKGHWVIKAPVHLLDLEGLLETYPDAQMVWTHRDPVLTMSSISSHIYALQKALGSGMEKADIGAAQWRNWRKALLAGTRTRTEIPAVEQAILDISNRDVIVDPVGTVERIYAHFDRPFSAEFAEGIRHFVRHHKGAARRGKHRHSLEEYDLNGEVIRRELDEYYQRFGHLCQTLDR
ncbi:MAG: sulfotransferase family protein [Porticoccaceae bacterium]|nr:sulfotransferase family protein [Porticoccaceae bacterium]